MHRRASESALLAYLREEVFAFSAYYRRWNRPGPKTMDEFRALPFTSKADLLPCDGEPDRPLSFLLVPTAETVKENWGLARKAGLLAGRALGVAPRETLERDYRPIFLTATTGRSTAPVSFLYTAHDIERLAESGRRLADVLGMTPQDRGLSVFPYAPHLAFWQVVIGGFDGIIFILATGGGRALGTEANLRLMGRFKPPTILGVPGYVYHLFREADAKAVDLSHLKRVVLGAEHTPDGFHDRLTEIARRRGAGELAILGTYGFTEARIAWGECAPGSGYHLYPDMGHMEIIDPATGEVLPDGSRGEIVFTPIGGHGSVIVRYRTGDISEGGIVWDRCPHCGRTGPRLDSRISRVSNSQDIQLSKVRGTLVNLGALAEALFEFPGIDEWQVEIAKHNDDPMDLDVIRILCSLAPGAGDEASFRERLAENVRASIEVRPNEVRIVSREEILKRLGMETELKEKRILDLRRRRPTSR